LRSTQRISRYEIMWEREESLPTEITKVWSSGDPICNLGDIANTTRSNGISAEMEYRKVRCGDKGASKRPGKEWKT
jgi:hypothetical protein